MSIPVVIVTQSAASTEVGVTPGPPGPPGPPGQSGPNSITAATATDFAAGSLFASKGVSVVPVTVGGGLSLTNSIPVTTYILENADRGSDAVNALLAAGTVVFAGTVQAAAFVGDGSGLTGLPSSSPGGSAGQLQFNDGGAFGGAAAVVYSTTVTHVVITSQGAAITPLAVRMAASQTANAIEVRDSTGAMKAAIGPQTFLTDPLALILKTSNRAYYLGTHDGAGAFAFGRDTVSGQLKLEIQSAYVGFYPTSGLDNRIATTSGRLILCGREDGGAPIIDLNRRYSDSSASIGGTVNFWTRTSQTADALAVLAPGGGSTLTAIKASGGWQPPSMSDASAPNNTVYYSTTAGKLVYKDGGGVVNALY